MVCASYIRFCVCQFVFLLFLSAYFVHHQSLSMSVRYEIHSLCIYAMIFFSLSIKDFFFSHCFGRFVQLMFAEFYSYYNWVCLHWIAKSRKIEIKKKVQPFLVYPILIRYIWLHSEQCIWKLTTKCGKNSLWFEKWNFLGIYCKTKREKMDLNSKITIVRGRSSDICRNVIGQIVHTTHSITYNIGSSRFLFLLLFFYFIVRISMNDICKFFFLSPADVILAVETSEKYVKFVWKRLLDFNELLRS